ncbi:hypothetical protein [Nocardioides aestuarii]|uniref:Prokaryotic membrane lipoprotein lipid attachment site profile n=1 Tax=Nocardioides aestuarii TaxID=252231 RepID=A0ABW4THX1_9ACTN
MTRTSRILTAALASAALALTGCSGSDGSGSSDGGNGDRGGSANEFTAAGVSFEAPDGWEALDAKDADVSGENTADVAEGLGLTAEELQRTIAAVDLFVVDGDGPQDGFLSNINVLQQDGQLPDDKVIEQQFSQMGATVNDVSHPDAGIDDVTAVDYSLQVEPNLVEGISYLVPLGDQVVTITVSTPDRAESADIGEAVLASLTEAG